MARPKDVSTPAEGKREAILRAAREIFLEQGYAAASMDAVAAAASVSKATIYAHFDNKRALFEAIIRARCERDLGEAQLPAATADLDIRAGLEAIARRFLDLVLSPEALAMYRIIIAEAPRQPEIGEAFHAAGPAVGLAAVAAHLADLDRRGELLVPDPAQAAALFLGMLKGELFLRRILGLAPDPLSPEAVVRAAVDVVLRAYHVDRR